MKTMWFGTDEYREWVMCPDQGLQMNSVGYGNLGTFVNGGAWSAQSATKHREYNATFTGAANNVQKVLDFVDGQFGHGPFYMLDPFSQATNILPKWLAAPRLMVEGAPSFTKAVLPVYTTTGANSLRLPTKGATFTVPDSEGLRSFRFPIPSGWTMHVKWWGSATGATELRANGTAVAPDTAETRTGDWLDLTLAGNGTISITGIMVQAKPTGDSPDFSVFESGKGTTALDVRGTQLTGYSAVRGRVSATIDLVEVGGWL